MSVESTLERIPAWDDNDLARLLKNAMRLASERKRETDAEKIIDGVSQEWARRLTLYEENQYRATSPEIGVLGFLGYHVGQEGEPQWRRRQILDYVLRFPLPPVGSPAYIAEWGSSGSEKRRTKLCNVLRGLSENPAHRKSEKALAEWKDDLEYILEETAK